MAVRSGLQIQFQPGDVSHRHYPTFSTLDFGYGTDTCLNLHCDTTAKIDAVIAELVALRAEMTGAADPFADGPGCGQRHPNLGLACRLHRGGLHVSPAVAGEGDPDIEWPIRREPAPFPSDADVAAVLAAPNPPHHVVGPELCCQAPDNRDGGYTCTAQDGHEGPDHIAYLTSGEHHRWPVTAGAPLAVTEDEVDFTLTLTAGGIAAVTEDEGEPEPCRATAPISEHRCALPLGHSGMHEDGACCWSRDEAASVTA